MTTAVNGEITRGQYTVLREKRLADAEDDYRWRREPELSRFDAAKPLTMDYSEFLTLYREELAYPSQYRRSFAIDDESGNHIGNVMYYNIDAVHREAELGITIGDPTYWGRGYGTEAVSLLTGWLIDDLGFRRIYLKTLEWNHRARRAFAKVGFVECGRAYRSGNSFILMELLKGWREPARPTSRAADPV